MVVIDCSLCGIHLLHFYGVWSRFNSLNSIITYHLLNQQTEALDSKISTQDTAVSDIKQNIELIEEDAAKGQKQVKKRILDW